MENLKKVKETILELIYPSKCPFCGEIVSAGKKHSTEHNGICKACREKLPYIGEVRCMCCGKPLTDPAEEYCYDCTRQKHLFVDGRSLWVHKDAVENAVYAMKYQNRRIYGQTFGKEMAEHFLSYLWERKITLIVPVPLHSRRKRNIRGAFAVQKNVKGENIVLIDDIYTTGSTLDEAARVLKKAGAENVYFLTVSIGQGI